MSPIKSGSNPFSPTPVQTSAGEVATEPAAVVAKPFDELKLSRPQIDRGLEKLKRKGYFTVRVTQETKSYLQENNKIVANLTGDTIGKVLSFEDEAFALAATATAAQISEQMTGKKMDLAIQEFQIRHPHDQGADQWHQDSAPKTLTCITTLSGSGTEFVLPEISNKKFTMEKVRYGERLAPIGGEAAIQSDVKQAKKDKFYFFAAMGVKNEEIPKLVHRAPHETDRAIFLARWKPLKR